MMASYMRKEMSYRNCAEKLSQTTGLSISHAAVWNVIHALGDKLVHDEKELVETGKKEDLRGGAGKFLYYLKKPVDKDTGIRS